jgi:predicted secreted protein
MFPFSIIFLSLIIQIVKSETIYIESNNTYSISANNEISIKIHSRPTAGLIWAMIPQNGSKISVQSEYGEFLVDEKDSTKGYQQFKLTCKSCSSGESYLSYFLLKKPWKDSPTEIRKIYFLIK